MWFVYVFHPRTGRYEFICDCVMLYAMCSRARGAVWDPTQAPRQPAPCRGLAGNRAGIGVDRGLMGYCASQPGLLG